MRRQTQLGALVGVATLLALAVGACGGGRTAVIGFGNSGNRIIEEWGIAEELADVLADSETTPEISDEILVEIFGAILDNARTGDAEAALIVLSVAEQQRENDED